MNGTRTSARRRVAGAGLAAAALALGLTACASPSGTTTTGGGAAPGSASAGSASLGAGSAGVGSPGAASAAGAATPGSTSPRSMSPGSMSPGSMSPAGLPGSGSPAAAPGSVSPAALPGSGSPAAAGGRSPAGEPVAPLPLPDPSPDRTAKQSPAQQTPNQQTPNPVTPNSVPAQSVPQSPSTGGQGATPVATTANRVTFNGFGPAKVGDRAMEFAHTLGLQMLLPHTRGPETCWYRQFADQPGVVIMMMYTADAPVRRIDVDAPGILTDTGLGVGSTIDQVLAAYPNAKVSPHLHVEGAKYVDVTDGVHSMWFEVNTAGTVTRYRVGDPDPIAWVDGCI